MRQILARFTVVVLLLGVASCTGDGPDYTWLRVVNAVPDSPTLRASWDKYSFLRDVTFGVATSEGGESLLKSFGNSAEVTVRYLGSSGQAAGTLLAAEVQIEQDSTSTVVVAGRFDAPELITFVTPRPARPLPVLTFQFVHAALDFGTVDVYVTAPDTELTATAPLATVPPRGATAALQVPFGALRIRLTPAGSLDVLYDSGERTFAEDPRSTGPGAQWLFTVAPAATAGSSPVFLVATNGRDSARLLDAGGTPLLRAFHGIRERPAVDVLTAFDPEPEEGQEETPGPELDQLLFTGLGFRDRSPLLATPSGDYRLAFRETGAEAALAFSAPRDFSVGNEYAAFLFRSTETDVVIVAESTTRSIATEVRLRFAHLALDTGLVSVYLSDTEADALDVANRVLLNIPAGTISPHFSVREGERFLTFTKRELEAGGNSATAPENIIYGPAPVTLVPGDVFTWVAFPGDAAEDPPVLREFDDLAP